MKHLPNFLTCCNLICGCLGIIFLWQHPDVPAAYFVWAACIFDFFDGFAARMLKYSSPIGKELDSLADVVSFGILPSLMMYRWLSSEAPDPTLAYVALMISVCSAIRLAVFNVDETQSDSFRGVPTPANALFITSLPFLEQSAFKIELNAIALIIVSIVFSMLLVSRFELFALKFKNFTLADNKLRFTFLGLSALLIVLLQFAALPVIIILYIGLSLGARAFSQKGR